MSVSTTKDILKEKTTALINKMCLPGLRWSMAESHPKILTPKAGGSGRQHRILV